MSGYKLADGSLSTDYEIGDTFTKSIAGCAPDLVTCTGHDGEWCVTNSFIWAGIRSVKWDILTPTPETKRKVAERKRYAEEAEDAIANQRGCKESSSIADAVSKARREGVIITGFEYNENDGTVKCTTTPMDKDEPLARIVDWRGGEEVLDNDVVINGRDYCTVSYDDFKALYRFELGEDDWDTVIRINTDALPKQRTLTIAEAEREFGVKIINDNSKN